MSLVESTKNKDELYLKVTSLSNKKQLSNDLTLVLWFISLLFVKASLEIVLLERWLSRNYEKLWEKTKFCQEHKKKNNTRYVHKLKLGKTLWTVAVILNFCLIYFHLCLHMFK